MGTLHRLVARARRRGVAAPSLIALVVAIGSSPRAHAEDPCIAAYERAQELRLDGRLRAARGELSICSRSSCPALTTSDCALWLSQVDAELPSVIVESRDSNGPVAAVVTIDGETVDPATPAVLDPGSHVAVCRAAGRSATVRFDLARGEKRRSVSCPLGAASRAPAPSSGSRSAVPFIVGGVGLALVGIGAAIALKGVSDRADLKGRCYPHCSTDDVDGVRQTLLAGDIVAGAGLVGLTVGVVLFFTDSAGTAAARPRAAALWRF